MRKYEWGGEETKYVIISLLSKIIKLVLKTSLKLDFIKIFCKFYKFIFDQISFKRIFTGWKLQLKKSLGRNLKGYSKIRSA